MVHPLLPVGLQLSCLVMSREGNLITRLGETQLAAKQTSITNKSLNNDHVATNASAQWTPTVHYRRAHPLVRCWLW